MRHLDRGRNASEAFDQLEGADPRVPGDLRPKFTALVPDDDPKPKPGAHLTRTERKIQAACSSGGDALCQGQSHHNL